MLGAAVGAFLAYTGHLPNDELIEDFTFSLKLGCLAVIFPGVVICVRSSRRPTGHLLPNWPGQPHRTQKEAERGHAEAQFTLGLMYANGQCVPEDKAEATKWYGKAAEQGNVDAQKALGAMYATGDGVPKNYSEAYAWYSVAAKNGDKDAKAFLSKAKAALTPDQLAVAQRRAAELNEQINANKAK